MASYRGYASVSGAKGEDFGRVAIDLWANVDPDVPAWGGFLYAVDGKFGAWVAADHVLTLILESGSTGSFLIAQKRRQHATGPLEIVGTSASPLPNNVSAIEHY